jgi:hypothetical protein
MARVRIEKEAGRATGLLRPVARPASFSSLCGTYSQSTLCYTYGNVTLINPKKVLYIITKSNFGGAQKYVLRSSNRPRKEHGIQRSCSLWR